MEKIRIGITGQAGFVGTHLYNTLGLYPDGFERILFKDEFFQDSGKLNEFVRNCDVIVHLAAVNRHPDENELYKININLVQALINAMEQENVIPHVLFSSSIQEKLDNLYGKSKLEGRKLFERWATVHHTPFTGFVIPNVYGPFGAPHYNSFIATFCYKLTNRESPTIIQDNDVDLIYVSSLCAFIITHIESVHTGQEKNIRTIEVPSDFTGKVSEILNILNIFKEQYFDRGIIPVLTNKNEFHLFNTFCSYMDLEKTYPRFLKQNTDNRGTFVETIRLGVGGQVSFSTTKPGITRGNHYHTRKIERFTVIKGKARIQLRKIGTAKIWEFELDGESPSYVDMPVWYTHNITNIGTDNLYAQFWINEWYDESDPDTFFETV